MSDHAANPDDARRHLTPEVTTPPIAPAAESADTRVSPEQATPAHDAATSGGAPPLELSTGSDAEKWSLPERFRLDESNPDHKRLLEQAEQQQRLWAQNVASPFGRSSPEEQERARSVKIAEQLRTTLAGVEKRIDAHTYTISVADSGKVVPSPDVDAELRTLLDDARALRHQLAERYAIIGRYDLAAQIEPEPPYRDNYVAILDAVQRDDDESCECPPHRGQGTQSFSISQQFVVQDIWSIKHGCVMPLIKCNACGHLNVRPMPAHLSEQRGHRATAHQLAGRLSPAEAAKALTAAGHTSTRLLK